LAQGSSRSPDDTLPLDQIIAQRTQCVAVTFSIMPSDLVLVDGIRLGGLVQISDLSEEQINALGQDVNGEFGQVIGYEGGPVDKFYVYLMCGAAGYFEPKNVNAAMDLKKPAEGGDETSFDMLMAPKTDAGALGSEISQCLLQKGFCVLKICQSAQKMESTFDMIRSMGEEGDLSRLPEEVEEGYLGNGCQGKVAWLDYTTKGLAQDANVVGNDGNLSYLAEIIQPFTMDLFDGEYIDERTPALVCMSLTSDEEPEYPFPESDDGTLGAFLGTWRRTLLRAVHFSGPGTASVQLTAKEGPKAESIPNLQGDVPIAASPNTILLFRPDVFEYSCDCPDETLMLITNFLSASPLMTFSHVEGETKWLNDETPGPPPPPGDEKLYVVNSVARLPGLFDNQWSYLAALTGACDPVQKIPLHRGDIDPYWTEDTETFQSWQSTGKHAGCVEGVELFDNKYFEISNAEAAGMDPVQRLVLETGAQSLAMNGLTKKIMNRKSTHAGFAVGNDKLDWQNMPKDIQIGGALGGTSTVLAIIANRFSFVFNMKGPNFVCDTACSASLTSTHCVKLMMLERTYDPVDFFISMGAHLVLQAALKVIGGAQSHMNTAGGRCFTFNASADGYLIGEGVSGIMLKYGAHRGAESDAVLRATGAGQDGRSASLTAPNGPAQEQLISRCIKEAQMTPPESTVWECHGTGTSLGDPIEVGSVRKVQIRMPRSEPLMITSVKTNFGHLEGGAAMGGICKCVLQCKHAKCLSTLHLRTLNPHLEHAAFEAIFQTENAKYAYHQGHSQVSSFGFGGSNGHGIFWGENIEYQPNLNSVFHKKIQERPPPQVRVLGKNPDEWEADFPDTRTIKKGTKFHISINPNDVSEAIKWEMVEEGNDEDAEEEDCFYAVTGNFNEWSDDRMAPGDLDGVHTASVEVPDNGVLEFRILKDGDDNETLGPASMECSNRSEAIIGPEKGLKNKWVIRGLPGQEVNIEFLCKRGKRSILWIMGEGGVEQDE